MNIFEIDNAIMSCVDAETGELIDIEALERLEMLRDQKIENVVLWIKENKALAEAIKAEKQELAKRQQVLENKNEQLKRYLDMVLNGQKFQTAKVSVSYRKSTSVDVDITELMKYDACDNYLRYKDPEPDKTAIKEVLQHGLELPGCKLVEKNSVQIK